jgi:hypothetical protein
MELRLTKNNDADIRYALASLLCGAIHFAELKEWLYFVIENTDSPPAYIFDMLDVKRKVDFKPNDIMGWTPSSFISDNEMDFLTAIGFHRGINSFEDTMTREEATLLLQGGEAFYSKAKAFFPMIDLERAVGPDPDKGW